MIGGDREFDISKRVRVLIIVSMMIVPALAGFWWANIHDYGVAGHLISIWVAFIAQWALLWGAFVVWAVVSLIVGE